MSLAKELERLADRLEQAAGKQTTRGALGKLAWEYAVLAGDRLLQAEQAGAIQDAALLAQIAIQHPDEQARRNYAFLNVVQKWLPTVAPNHRPDKRDAAHRYADDLRVLAGAIGKLTAETASDNRPWTGPTTQAAIAAKFKVNDRTVRRWVNGETKGPVEVRKEGSMFFYRDRPE